MLPLSSWPSTQVTGCYTCSAPDRCRRTGRRRFLQTQTDISNSTAFTGAGDGSKILHGCLHRLCSTRAAWTCGMGCYITYQTTSTNEPAYLHSLLKHYVPSCSLRSSDSYLLSVPRVDCPYNAYMFQFS